MTLRTKGDESTAEPPRSTPYIHSLPALRKKTHSSWDGLRWLINRFSHFGCSGWFVTLAIQVELSGCITALSHHVLLPWASEADRRRVLASVIRLQPLAKWLKFELDHWKIYRVTTGRQNYCQRVVQRSDTLSETLIYKSGDHVHRGMMAKILMEINSSPLIWSSGKKLLF